MSARPSSLARTTERSHGDGSILPRLTLRDSPTRQRTRTRRAVARALWAHNAVSAWRVIASIEFPDESGAADFERYLKSGADRPSCHRTFLAR